VSRHLGLSKSAVSRAATRGQKLIVDQFTVPFCIAEEPLVFHQSGNPRLSANLQALPRDGCELRDVHENMNPR